MEPTSTSTLRFLVESDLTEDILTSEGNEIRVYLLSFCASKRNFVTKSSRQWMHNVHGEDTLDAKSKKQVT